MTMILTDKDAEVIALINVIKQTLDIPDNVIRFSIHFSVEEPVRVEAVYYAKKREHDSTN